MNEALLQTWHAAQDTAVDTVTGVAEEARWIHYHPDLSPLLWHLGHMAFIETYWVREVVMGDGQLTVPLHDFYFPERSPKFLRGVRLREEPDTVTQARTSFAGNRDRVETLLAEAADHRLLQDRYLIHFVLQHHCQHLETMAMVLQQLAMSLPRPEYRVARPLESRDVKPLGHRFAPATTAIGHPGGPEAYDNEFPRHTLELDGFILAQTPITNAEYLGFMEAGGYANDRWWSPAGRAWRAGCAPRAPQHWRRDSAGHWYGIGPDGPGDLDPDTSVHGISYHEAQAFAAYAGARLPHEYEWEHAMTSEPGLTDTTGGAWEWCANPFHPYPGFRAFPYDGYSTPWFDGAHYVLRGSSPATRPSVKRPSFRNFYTGDKRHIFAGLRLAWNG